MRADIEAELMRRVHDGEHARDVIGDMLARGAIASPKQGWRTLEKWCGKGWYDFGVALDLGWMTEKAPCGRSVPLVHGAEAAGLAHQELLRRVNDEMSKLILGRTLAHEAVAEVAAGKIVRVNEV